MSVSARLRSAERERRCLEQRGIHDLLSRSGSRPPGAQAAGWVVAGLRGFAETVHSLVPAGFPAYARVLHPAYQGGRPVR